MVLDGCLQLLDIFRPPLSKGSLGLSVPLLSFLGRGIDLRVRFSVNQSCRVAGHTGLRPPLRFCTWVTSSWMKFGSSGSGDESEKDSNSEFSVLGIGAGSSALDMPGS